MNGILLVRKPAGISSFAVVAAARKKLGIRKIGHAGTLDPFAEGLLLLAIGSATRALSDFLLSEKTYEATVLFGATTETLDPESETHFSEDFPKITPNAVSSVLKEKFLGKIKQTPPIFSALKIQGKRAYDLARKGKEVKMPERETEVFSAKILGFSLDAKYQNLPAARILVRAKSGFYVRSFARDLAKECGTLGFCTALSRVSIGDFLLANATNIEDISSEKILPIIPEMLSLHAIFLSEEQKRDFFHGKSIFPFLEKDGRTAVFDTSQNWIGFAEISNTTLSPKKVIGEK